jgi:hypothetical protein
VLSLLQTLTVLVAGRQSPSRHQIQISTERLDNLVQF